MLVSQVAQHRTLSRRDTRRRLAQRARGTVPWAPPPSCPRAPPNGHLPHGAGRLGEKRHQGLAGAEDPAAGISWMLSVVTPPNMSSIVLSIMSGLAELARTAWLHAKQFKLSN